MGPRCRISDLMAEIARLEERYHDDATALEALEAVKFWAIEEAVESVSDGDLMDEYMF